MNTESTECIELVREVHPLIQQLKSIYEAFSTIVNKKASKLKEKTQENQSHPSSITYQNLTKRENEVAKAYIKWGRTKIIANKLHLSPHTVKTHIATIKRKFGVRTGHDLLKKLLLGE